MILTPVLAHLLFCPFGPWDIVRAADLNKEFREFGSQLVTFSSRGFGQTAGARSSLGVIQRTMPPRFLAL